MAYPFDMFLVMNNSAYPITAKWLMPILKPLHKEIVEHSVKDSFEFVDNMRNLSVNNKFMISLEMLLLFTNIPLLKTVDIRCNELTER